MPPHFPLSQKPPCAIAIRLNGSLADIHGMIDPAQEMNARVTDLSSYVVELGHIRKNVQPACRHLLMESFAPKGSG